MIGYKLDFSENALDVYLVVIFLRRHEREDRRW